LLENKESSVANRGEIVRGIKAAGDFLQLNPNRSAYDMWQNGCG